jgi:hypothetical protein
METLSGLAGGSSGIFFQKLSNYKKVVGRD